MKFDLKYAKRVGEKYRQDKEVEFSRPFAYKKFLYPLGLTVSSKTQYELKKFSEDRTLFSSTYETRIFEALHFVKYKILHTSGRTQQRYYNTYISIRNRIINANIKLIHSAVSSFKKKGHYIQDEDKCIEQCFIYLIRCADNFDPWKNFCFSTYASASLSKCFLPRHKKVREISLKTNTSKLIGHADLTIYPINNSQELWEERLVLIKNSNVLNDREKVVINNRFGFTGKELLLKDVGEILEISKERVRQIQCNAIQKLKLALQEEYILNI